MGLDKKAIERVLEINLELLEKKNADYSSTNLLVEGSRGVATRLVDKVARLRHLLSKDGSANYESIMDTFGDVANYGLIGQLIESGGWGADIQSVLVISGDVIPQLYRAKIETAIQASGVAFAWLDDVWRGKNTPKLLETRRSTTEALGDMSDAVILIEPLAGYQYRMLEYFRARGKTVVVVQNLELNIASGVSTDVLDFEGCIRVPTPTALKNFLQSGGFGGSEGEDKLGSRESAGTQISMLDWLQPPDKDDKQAGRA